MGIKILIALLLASFVAEGQVKQQLGTYGARARRLQADSAFRVPTVKVGVRDFNLGMDTAQLWYNKTDSTVEVYTGSQWVKVGGGSTGNGISELGTGLCLIKLNDSTYNVDTACAATKLYVKHYADSIKGTIPAYTFPYSVKAPGNAIQLKNDTTTSPPNFFYGTNEVGRFGYYPQSSLVGMNLYNSDGTLTGNRTVTTAGNSLFFNGGKVKFDSIQISNSVTGEDFIIRNRNIALGFPVVTVEPFSATKNIAFNISPKAGASDYSNNGLAWLHILDSYVSNGSGNVTTAAMGITSTDVYVGSRTFGGTPKPFRIIVDANDRITLSTSNTATFNIGKITQSQSISGDYVGYTLFNTNNSVAESNPIFFIGQDFASNRFGYLRWNNNATTPGGSGFRQPNQLEIISNINATEGIVIGALGNRGKTKFVTGSGGAVRGIVDSLGQWGFGTTIPTSLVHINGVAQLGTSGSMLGQLQINGNTSGTATLTVPAAAGTPTLTLPTTTSTLVGDVATQTLTNKRWVARVGSTTSSATPTINTDNYDIYKLTAQAVDITSVTTNLGGTPNDGDVFEIQITGTAARAITWGSAFVSSTVTLPTTTVTTATLTVIFQYYTTSSYGNNKWVCANYY